MIINCAYRYELKPNNKQRTHLAKHAGIARFAFNWALARSIKRFEENEGKEKFTNAIELHREWKPMEAGKCSLGLRDQ
jgi:putative transposase